MKFKNTSIVAVLVIIFSLMLSGCGDPVKSDLQNFDKSCESVTETMTSVEKSISEATGDNAGKVLIENAEKLDSTKKTIEAIEVKTEDVKAVKSILVEALGLTAEGCKAIGEAAQNPEAADQKAVEDAQGKLTKGIELFNDFSTKYEELANKHGLKIEK
ncbi:MAG: hypothetical protein K0R50_2807 [Eubacterium sp.]|nr:hypothetical protein [Eubacterium sp.]